MGKSGVRGHRASSSRSGPEFSAWGEGNPVTNVRTGEVTHPIPSFFDPRPKVKLYSCAPLPSAFSLTSFSSTLVVLQVAVTMLKSPTNPTPHLVEHRLEVTEMRAPRAMAMAMVAKVRTLQKENAPIQARRRTSVSS